MLVLFAIFLTLSLFWWFVPAPSIIYDNFTGNDLLRNIGLVLLLGASFYLISQFVLDWIILDSSFTEIRLVFVFASLAFVLLSLRYILTQNKIDEKMLLNQEAIDTYDLNLQLNSLLQDAQNEFEFLSNQTKILYKKLQIQAEALEAEHSALQTQRDKLDQDRQSFIEEIERKQKEYENIEEHLKKHYDDKEIQLKQFHEHTLAMKTDELKRLYDQHQNTFQSALRDEYSGRLHDFKLDLHEKMQDRMMHEKQHILKDIFAFDKNEANDVFELKRTQETMRKEQEVLQRSQFLLDVEKKVSSANEHVLHAKQASVDIKSDQTDIRADLKLTQANIEHGIYYEKLMREKDVEKVSHKIEIEEERRMAENHIMAQQMVVQDEIQKGRIIELRQILTEQVQRLDQRTKDGFRDVTLTIGELKLKFGKEIMRLDGQQDKILNELEKYKLKTEAYVNKCQAMLLEAEKSKIYNQELFNKAELLYRQYVIESQGMENKLINAAEKFDVRDGKFLNDVTAKKNELEHIADQNNLSFRDIALEKKGSEIFYREKNIEHEKNIQEVEFRKKEVLQLQQLLDERNHNAAERMKLNHQKNIAVQRRDQAVFKERNSNGLIVNLAKQLESKWHG